MTEKFDTPSAHDAITKTKTQFDPSEERLITVDQFAERLGCSGTSIYNWSNPKHKDHIKGFPVPVQLGQKRTRFRLSEVLNFIAIRAPSAERSHHFREKRHAA
jgi:predicted DNA-binding transcriptional regulator AlpA